MRMRPASVGSDEHGQCDLAVKDDLFRLVTVELTDANSLWIWLPWRLDYHTQCGFVYELKLDSFGSEGLN